MDAINVGFLSIIPPLIAIGLVLLTKEVISSLTIGILSGAFIYSYHTSEGFLSIIINGFDVMVRLMVENFADNVSLVVFLCLLGSLVVVITKAGGSRAYGEWASKKIRSKSGAQLATMALGCLIFIDDYFNCLTVGTVMKPVTDKYNVSRTKLAYIIDATAAPICMIAPVSSWAASVVSHIDNTHLNGMETFIAAIPYNLYSILTIIMVIVMCTKDLDYGQMARFEREAASNNEGLGKNTQTIAEENPEESSPKGTIFDLIIPISILIVASVLSMIYFGGYFDGGITISESFANTDTSYALAFAGMISIMATFLLFLPRKVISFKDFMEGIAEGIKSMLDAIMILILAWTISGICSNLLSTGSYVSNLVATSNMPIALIPVIMFCVAAFLSFSTGTSWGTFGILIPVIAAVCKDVAPHLTVISLSAMLAGSVFGDHCSPISDTTILSSAGASCEHMDHVTTQIPYTTLVAGCCVIGYIVAGYTTNIWLTLASSGLSMFVAFVIIGRVKAKKKFKN